MNALDSMVKMLAPLGIYSLSPGNMVYKELSAYACALDALNGALETQLRESVPVTAESYGLAMLERIYGAPQDGIETEKRRQMLAARFSLTGGDFTPGGIAHALRALGLDAVIYEYPGQNLLHIVCAGSYTGAQRKWITAQANELLPAHLEIVLDFRTLDWAAIERKNMTFSAMDAKNMTWRAIEAYGV